MVISYEKLFGPYLKGAKRIKLVGPYIRYDYQIHKRRYKPTTITFSRMKSNIIGSFA